MSKDKGRDLNVFLRFIQGLRYNKCVATTQSLLLIFLLTTAVLYSRASDVESAESLKIEAAHNLNRLKAYGAEVRNNKIYEDEREKGLSEYLEEQERWDLLRERGLREYAREKKVEASPVEGGPEYREYLKEEKAQQQNYEKSRREYVSVRNRIIEGQRSALARLEAREYELQSDRPRYDFAKRSKNKWVNTSTAGGRGGGGFSGGSAPAIGGTVDFNQPEMPDAVPAAPNDFPPLPDFPTAEVPYDGGNYEELPVPPPVYDGTAGGVPSYDPAFGPEMTIPPPPPPPPDFDF